MCDLQLKHIVVTVMDMRPQFNGDAIRQELLKQYSEYTDFSLSLEFSRRYYINNHFVCLVVVGNAKK